MFSYTNFERLQKDYCYQFYLDTLFQANVFEDVQWEKQSLKQYNATIW